jgi:hypothetical protein
MRFPTGITAIGRPIDLNYPTNRAIALLAMAVSIVGTLARLLVGMPWLVSMAWGIGAGFSVFFAWALSRELDPDHDLSAFVAAGLMLIGLFLFELPVLLALLWMLVVLRIINRTTGLAAKPLDSLAMLGLGLWLTWQGDWVYGLVTAGAFLLDGWLPARLRRHLPLAGATALTLAVLTLFKGLSPGKVELPAMAWLVILVVSALFAPVIVASRTLQTVGDETGEALIPRRVQAAQALGLLTGILFAWWDGPDGISVLVPLWAAILGTGLYKIFRSGRRILSSTADNSDL